MRHGPSAANAPCGFRSDSTEPRREINPRRYVIVTSQRQHPNADARGRIYEHVLVMSEKLGRPLRPGAQQWDGIVWCNPPYSTAQQWIDKWAAHETGCLMTQVASRQKWRSALYDAADAVYIGQVEFARPDGSTLKFGWTPICVAFRGVGVEPAERLARADKFGAVLYGRHEALN